jgi:hypothetical protein
MPRKSFFEKKPSFDDIADHSNSEWSTTPCGGIAAS